jgi:hypothetical protein
MEPRRELAASESEGQESPATIVLERNRPRLGRPTSA